MKEGGGFMENFLATACQKLIFSDEVVTKRGFRRNLSERHHRDSIVVFNHFLEETSFFHILSPI
jgi:hypothetical protein